MDSGASHISNGAGGYPYMGNVEPKEEHNHIENLVCLSLADRADKIFFPLNGKEQIQEERLYP